jgi:hypothetical protein
VALAVPLAVVGAPSAAGAATSTVPAAPVADTPEASSTVAPAPSTTTTTVAAARCDPVAPTAVQFVGTALTRERTVVRYRVDEVRVGPRLGGTELDVTFLRDARFFDVGERYLVTAALDPDTGLYVSKVRQRRGEDPRCVAQDPIYTSGANGTPIDTGVFTGLHGTSGRVLRAFLLPLAGVVGLLAALVAVKWLAILLGRGVRRLVRGPVRP